MEEDLRRIGLKEEDCCDRGNTKNGKKMVRWEKRSHAEKNEKRVEERSDICIALRWVIRVKAINLHILL